ncbi:MAG TPA: hypothetical protein VFL85_02550 [Candidatus Saccharimonadales bacterium]|nr:hypothetical protein [Candidatus Saccharimonadales bacterium]
MKLFGRNKQPKPVIPPELQPYYADHRYGMGRRHTGLLIAGIVLVCIGIAVLLWLATHNWHFSPASNTDGTTSQSSQSGSSKQQSPAVQSPQDNKVLKQDTGKPAKTPLTGQTTKK